MSTDMRVRARIEAQGFLGLDDQTVNQINYWLRLSPAICMVWVAIGTGLESALILWWLVPFAALGAILPRHRFDVLYTYGLRYLVHGPRLPRYPLPRRGKQRWQQLSWAARMHRALRSPRRPMLDNRVRKPFS